MEGLYREKNGQLNFMPVEENTRDLYKYAGPVFLFDKCIAHVKLETWAVSPKKAYSNMLFQVKKELGYQPYTKLTISKNLIKKQEEKYGKSC